MEVALRQRPAGMGEYPGYYCYDAARPSWLPYWLDDTTESACKYSISTIVGNVASCVTGSPNCGAPPNPNPAVSGPGAGGPPLAAGNSTASSDPIATPSIPTEIGQAIGTVIGGASAGAASGLSAGLGDMMIPLLLVGGLVLLIALKR